MNNSQPGMRPSLTIGGRTFTDLSNLKILKTYCNGNNLATARAPNGTAGYTPSGSKAFRILAVEYQSIATTSATPTLCYSDNDLGFNSAGAFTNPVYEHGASSDYIGFTDGDINGINAKQAIQTNFLVPNGKYVGVVGAAATVCWIYGYEE